MAIHAGFRCRLIKQDQLSLNFALQGVALRTADIFVATGKRELSALIVIKYGWDPALHYVAVRAWRYPGLGRELVRVRVSMALFAFYRRPLELYFMSSRKRFMAIPARYHAVCSHQIEFRLGVVKPFYINPGPHIVASLAPQRGSIRSAQRHAILEFPLVGIFVACRARAVLEMERQNFVGAPGQSDLVAFRAGNRGVRPGQRKA